MDDFTRPSLWYLTLSVFWVSLLGIPKTLGIWVRGYPKHGDTQITVTPGVYPGTKNNGASVSSLYLLEEMGNKTNRSNIF